MRFVVGAICWLVLGAASAAAEPCAPGARVVGERDVVVAIELLLRERGVAVLAAPDRHRARCRHVVAEVAKGGRRIMVWVTDPEGRRVERLTEDPAAAATVIESWARRDLVVPLLAARASIPITGGEAPAAATAPPARFSVLLGADAGVSNDGAVWTAARAQGCALVGRVCIGGVIRYGFDLERSGDTRELDTHRRGLDLTVTAGVPIERGRVAITPTVGIGQMAITASRDTDPSDLDGQGESEQASAVHAALGCGAAIRVARAWSLRFDLAVAIAPFATEHLGDGALDALPASARMQTWLGFGVAYGGL